MRNRELKKRIAKYRLEIIKILEELISIPTSNPPGENYGRCARYFSKKLSEWGIEHRTIAVPEERYPRFSIVGGAEKKENALHFHGHYDVVPAASSSQFQPLLKGNVLFGRGSSDMKGGLVSMLFALRLIKEGARGGRVHLSFSLVPDEETGGFRGTQHLFEKGILPLPCKGVLMPEPTSGIIWNGNKGALTCRIALKGKTAHVGLAYKGTNAFENMVLVASDFIRLKKIVESRFTSYPIYPPEAGRSVMLIGGESGSGVSFNAVPESAFFTADLRINPEDSLEGIKAEMKAILDSHRKKGRPFEVEIIQEGKASHVSPETPVAAALALSATEVRKVRPTFGLCPGLCEIRYFNNSKIPAYAFGPGILEVSHCPREYIRIKDVLDFVEIYVLTAFRLAAQ